MHIKAMQCRIKNCQQISRKRGLCSTHYTRWWVHGDPLFTKHKYHKHGLSKIPEYQIWHAMKQRCENKNSKAFNYYGARGIKVCKSWSKSFERFYKDMGKRPDGLTLERVDNNKGYRLSNCKWATRTQQSMNVRINKRNSSGFRGVCPKRNKWAAYIKPYYKSLYLGTFDTTEEAALAYDIAAIQLYGLDAKLNILT